MLMDAYGFADGPLAAGFDVLEPILKSIPSYLYPTAAFVHGIMAQVQTDTIDVSSLIRSQSIDSLMSENGIDVARLLPVHLERFGRAIKHQTAVTYSLEVTVNGVGTYDLVGVVHHTGNLNNGGYVAEFKNHLDDGNWYYANDSDVYRFTHKPSAVVSSQTVAVLLYQLRQPAIRRKTTGTKLRNNVPVRTTIPTAIPAGVPRPVSAPIRVASEAGMTRVSARSGVPSHGTFGTRGINNLGNTCYLASAVQMITHAQPFVDYMQTTVSFGHSDQKVASLKMLVNEVWDSPPNQSIGTDHIDYVMQTYGFVNRQRDAGFDALDPIIQSLESRDLFPAENTLSSHGIVIPVGDKPVDVVAQVGSQPHGTFLNLNNRAASLMPVYLVRAGNNDNRPTAKSHAAVEYALEISVVGVGTFDLIGIAHHFGTSMTSGHWVAEFKNYYDNGNWYYANDSNVYRFSRNPSAVESSTTASVLLYQLRK